MEIPHPQPIYTSSLTSPANVQFDIDAEKFYKIYLDLMTRQIAKR